MWQCNLTIAKDNEAVSYLQKIKYDVYHVDHSNGWKSYYSDKRCYLDQMVGSKSSVLEEYGKYPDELSAADYMRAVKKMNDFFDLVLSKRKENNFSERKKQIHDITVKYNKLAIEIGQWNTSSKKSLEEKNELKKKKKELKILENLQKEYQKDKALMYAICYDEDKIYKDHYQYIGRWSFDLKEYLYYHRLFSKLLKYEPYIYFTYLDEEERKKFKLVHTISLNDLRIGDLALLCANDVLKICR